MKPILPFFTLLLLHTIPLLAQDFTGQWKGEFVDKSATSGGWGGDSYEYILDLNEAGTKVNGFSYTYFTDGSNRYYTICSLEGFFDQKNNYVEVREVKRTKTNVPEKIRNCFQVHKLYYQKGKDSETLSGSWIPAPGQSGDCGHGITILNRRKLNRDIPLFAKTAPSYPYTPPQPKKVAITASSKPVSGRQKQTALKDTKRKPALKTNIAVDSSSLGLNKNHIVKEMIIDNPFMQPEQKKMIVPTPGFEQRNSTVLQTIIVSQPVIQIDLYDNGEIDGDSISLFFNSKLLLAHQRLSEKPISLKIDVDNQDCPNELIMYADNLGTIPPNTALMIVTDGINRYEVRITSDLKRNGAVRFVLK